MAVGSFVLLGVGNDGRSSRSVGGGVVALTATFSCGCGEGWSRIGALGNAITAAVEAAGKPMLDPPLTAAFTCLTDKVATRVATLDWSFVARSVFR